MANNMIIYDTHGADNYIPNDDEITDAQVRILEKRRIEDAATIAGLKAENAELKQLMGGDVTAQIVLSSAAIALSNDIYERMEKLHDIPKGLSEDERIMLVEKRQTVITELKQKNENYKKYIRGEI